MLMWPHTIDSKAQERDSKDETEDNSERLLDSELAYNLRERLCCNLRSAHGTLLAGLQFLNQHLPFARDDREHRILHHLLHVGERTYQIPQK